jgi:hypothetical protein
MTVPGRRQPPTHNALFQFADAFVAQPDVQKTEMLHASTGLYLLPL